MPTKMFEKQTLKKATRKKVTDKRQKIIRRIKIVKTVEISWKTKSHSDSDLEC